MTVTVHAEGANRNTASIIRSFPKKIKNENLGHLVNI